MQKEIAFILEEVFAAGDGVDVGVLHNMMKGVGSREFRKNPYIKEANADFGPTHCIDCILYLIKI